MQSSLLCRPPGLDCAGPVLHKEGRSKAVSPHHGQVQQAVPLLVLDVQVAFVVHQGVGYALVTVQESQVQRDVAFLVTLVQLVRQLVEHEQEVTKDSLLIRKKTTTLYVSYSQSIK